MAVEVVGGVGRCRATLYVPNGVAYVLCLTQVSECHDIARVVIVAALVGYPDLDSGYLHP